MTRPDPAFPALQDAMRVGMGDPQAPFATLDDLIGSSAGLAEVSAEVAAGIAENEAVVVEHQACHQFGRRLLEGISAVHGAAVAEAVRVAFTVGTLPATPARAKQDRIYRVLTDRLDKIASEAGK